MCSAVTAFISAQLSSAGQLFSALSFTDSYDWEGHWIDFTHGGGKKKEVNKQSFLSCHFSDGNQAADHVVKKPMSCHLQLCHSII